MHFCIKSEYTLIPTPQIIIIFFQKLIIDKKIPRRLVRSDDCSVQESVFKKNKYKQSNAQSPVENVSKIKKFIRLKSKIAPGPTVGTVVLFFRRFAAAKSRKRPLE